METVWTFDLNAHYYAIRLTADVEHARHTKFQAAKADDAIGLFGHDEAQCGTWQA